MHSLLRAACLHRLLLHHHLRRRPRVDVVLGRRALLALQRAGSIIHLARLHEEPMPRRAFRVLDAVHAVIVATGHAKVDADPRPLGELRAADEAHGV